MTILVTRPSPEGEELVQRLRSTGRNAWSMPLLEFSPGRGLPKLPQYLALLQPTDIIIAVSHQALRYAGPYLQSLNSPWPASVDYYAIGRRSALQLHQYCQQKVVSPSPGLTEGLLARPELQTLSGRKILILRGNGGRELLADTLRSRGATVKYCECYQRVAISYQGPEQALHWRRQGITTLVVTSGEMLNLLYDMIPDIDRNEWLLHCRLVVVSERLATLAGHFGWRHIIVADGADNDALLRALR